MESKQIRPRSLFFSRRYLRSKRVVRFCPSRCVILLELHQFKSARRAGASSRAQYKILPVSGSINLVIKILNIDCTFCCHNILCHNLKCIFSEITYTVELHLSGLIWTASYPDMQKVRVRGFFFENRLHW